MRWQPWSADVFSESAATGRPILLFISAAWSPGCERMQRETFADARVREQIERTVIPVRVDADERPDIADRYGLDGWPSTLLLTADGEVLHGGTYLDPPALVRLLDRTLRACREAPHEIARRATEARAQRVRSNEGQCRLFGRDASPGSSLPARIAASLAFPGPERFLHGDAIVFLLRHGTSSSTAAARAMLDAALASPVCRDDGAVMRCAATPDWSPAAEEVTAEANASAVRAFAEASRFDGTYRSAAERSARFLSRTWLQPSSDVTTDAGAELAAASLAAAAVLDRRELMLGALASLERLALATYRPGFGVRHLAAEDAPGFASDYIALAAALLDAHELTAELPYLMLAEELGHQLLRWFFDAATGAIRDRVHGPGDAARLVEPAYPFGWNARAAGALSRLAATGGEPAFADVSAQLLGWAAARWEQHGLDAATLGLYWPDR